MHNTMYFDMDNGPELIDEDFLAALNLLHSTDNNSSEKLRQILELSIERKYGQKMQRYCSWKREEIGDPGKKLSAKFNIGDLKMNRKFQTVVKDHASTNIPLPAIITKTTTRIGQNIANVFITDDKTEIPTISIPDDQGSSAIDGALCKICTGPKLGPMILLECQECQDVYHPLCHQPPVLDLDIYDPRLVWHCAKCAELSEAAAIVASSGLEGEIFARKNGKITKNEAELTGKDLNIFNDSMERHNFFRMNKSRLSSRRQIPISESMGQLFTDRNGSLKNSQAILSSTSTISSGPNLRKRVGSKITVTRGSGK